MEMPSSKFEQTLSQIFLQKGHEAGAFDRNNSSSMLKRPLRNTAHVGQLLRQRALLPGVCSHDIQIPHFPASQHLR